MREQCRGKGQGQGQGRRTLLLPIAFTSFSWIVLSISNERRMLTAYLSCGARHKAGAAAAAAAATTAAAGDLKQEHDDSDISVRARAAGAHMRM